MYILYLFEAVYISHDLTLEKKGLECSLPHTDIALQHWTVQIYVLPFIECHTIGSDAVENKDVLFRTAFILKYRS
jgi:hypothetical protein